MKRKITFETLGCRYNRLESAEMAYELEQAGYVHACEGERSDVVVINTCTVTSRSDAKARAAIRRARDENPGAIVVVAGCYSEINPEEAASQEGVDLVLGSANKFDIARAVAEFTRDGKAKTVMGEAPETLPVRPVTGLEGRTNAYIKIQSGCGEVCSFCVVKIARGKSRSASADDIVEQAGRLSAAGTQEVVLTGINLGEYGEKRGESLANLVSLILKKTDVARVRLSSVNPTDVTEGLIDLVAESPRVCRHLHIPLQSGSDSVLERMRRPYDSAMYEELLNRIKDRCPGVGLGADVMVGFPGETDEEFAQTAGLIERVPLMMLHVFAYSPRRGTEAYAMKGAIPKDVKKERSAFLKNIAATKNEAARLAMVGKTLDVLVENSRGGDGFLKGFSDNYFPVRLEGPDTLMNRIVPVRITASCGGRLEGEPV